MRIKIRSFLILQILMYQTQILMYQNLLLINQPEIVPAGFVLDRSEQTKISIKNIAFNAQLMSNKILDLLKYI